MPATFAQIISGLSDETRAFIEAHIEQARALIQEAAYDREDDDITPCLFEEIGATLFQAVYSPADPEPEPLPVLTLEPGEQAFYCRKCEAPRAFVLTPAYGWQCKVCGNAVLRFTTILKTA